MKTLVLRTAANCRLPFAGRDVAPVAEEGAVLIEDLLNGQYIVRKEIVFDIHDDDFPGARIVIPVGFKTDFGSIPRAFRGAIEGIGTPRDLVYLLHDWVYGTEYFGWLGVAYKTLAGASAIRCECDELLLMGCKMVGDDWLTRNTIWGAVRLFGGAVWGTHTPASIAANRALLAQGGQA